jgi:hypothetical protein
MGFLQKTFGDVFGRPSLRNTQKRDKKIEEKLILGFC